ncbi:MAG TPA: hypothetical protein VHJ83_01605, partial [Micromonosporaceae bacterium]|nr:hypothetical protein [Micromonosporaceae bacterium]
MALPLGFIWRVGEHVFTVRLSSVIRIVMAATTGRLTTRYGLVEETLFDIDTTAVHPDTVHGLSRIWL